MPLIDIRLPARRLDPAAKAALAERLTAILIRMEGGADTEGGRGFAWVMFTELAAGDWYFGGRIDNRHVSASGRFLFRVTIPEGYMDAATKGGVQADVTQAILAVTGAADVDSRCILVIIDEVTEGDWSAGGKTISIADTVGLSKGSARYGWVRAYFAARARQFSAAGCPAGAGGLLPPEPSHEAV